MIGLVTLSLAGLLAADVATWAALRSFLLGRVDDQLQTARMPLLRALGGGPGPHGGPQEGPPGATAVGRGRGGRLAQARLSLPPGTYAELRDSSGATRSTVGFELDDATVDRPRLPDRLPDRPPGDGAEPAIFTAGDHRVMADRLSSGDTLLVSVPLGDVRQTLRRLLAVEVVVTVLVVAGLGLLAWWVVKLGLRPLERMATSAAAIAAGDLSRRVEPADPRTEVGRLGLALNAMLAQIEEAFAERHASEARLRRFLADASHELRTPLTSIRGYAELFRRGADRHPGDLAKAMSRIEEESARMTTLVDDLFLLARLDEGRPLERTAVDLTRVGADAVADARVADPERSVRFEGDGPVVVSGDEARLRQVAANLVTNALKHTPAGTPVTVRVSADSGEAVLEVSDRGPGLTPEEAAHAFERFYRGDSSRRRDTGTTGLGLAIVNAIATAHGGRSEVEPTPGGGATFRVRVPLEPAGRQGAP